MDLESLITTVQRGDSAAFEQLVRRYQNLVLGYTIGMLGDYGLAEDATQEAFINAYKALNRFKGGNFKAWLMRIATNSCYDELRRRKRRPQSCLDEMTEENESFTFLRDPEEGPESKQQQLEMMRAIEQCLNGLPDDQRITAVMCDVEGYDYNEIAEITSVSLGTVKSRMNRARKKLRDCLRGFGELLPASYRL